MAEQLLVDSDALREQVRQKYREVAVDPGGSFHFHVGRPNAARLGYDLGVVDSLPGAAVESFAGVGNPFSLRRLAAREKVVDVGSGGGFDSFVAAGQIGKAGRVRWKGRKPHNRGTTMNPTDHPMGGGEGRTAGGRNPCSPSGVPAKGGKTRKKRKPGNKAIVRRRPAGPFQNTA